MSSVNIIGNRGNEYIRNGQELPFLVQTESPSSVTLLVDSTGRYNGTPCNFRVMLNNNVPRPRYLQLQRAVIPKLPNVTKFNNTLRINLSNGSNTGNFTIPVGMYNTTSMCNVLAAAINDAYVAAGIVDSVTVTYSQLSRNFTITPVSLGLAFDDNCSFIKYGQSLCGFSGYSVTGYMNPLSSGLAGMLYCRYLVVTSVALCQFAYAYSVVTNPQNPSRVIGVIDLAGMYDVYDFDVSVPYSGIYKNMEANGPILFQINGSMMLLGDLDFTITDAYGHSLDDVLDNGVVSTLGVSLIMNITL